ncbi:MAG TPA: hypothetical protein VFX70_00580 [Mycobacteriales bacterium]|nr:hypothetical protein [Mycobacteriales bacterium]
MTAVVLVATSMYVGLLVVPAELVALTTRDPVRRRTALRILTMLLAPLSRPPRGSPGNHRQSRGPQTTDSQPHGRADSRRADHRRPPPC